MARGHKDYNQYNYFANRAINDIEAPSVFDVGFSRTDGGGRIVFYEDMRTGGRRFSMTSAGAGLDPYIGEANGGFYGFYKPLVLDPVAVNGSSTINAYFAGAISENIGIEVGYLQVSNHANFDIDLYPNTPSGITSEYRVRLAGGTGSIQYMVDGSYIDLFTPSVLSSYDNKLSTIKFVVDTVNNKFVRLLYNGVEYSIGVDPVMPWTSRFGGGATISIKCSASSALRLMPIYLHYVIVTVDEP